MPALGTINDRFACKALGDSRESIDTKVSAVDVTEWVITVIAIVTVALIALSWGRSHRGDKS